MSVCVVWGRENRAGKDFKSYLVQSTAQHRQFTTAFPIASPTGSCYMPRAKTFQDP